MTEHSQMAVPKWSSEIIFDFAIYMLLVFATIVAILNLYFQVAVIVSLIWLAFMTWGVWSLCKDNGGYRERILDILAFLSIKHFVEIMPNNVGSVEIRYGFQLFGHRFFRIKVPLDMIERVNWSPGNAHVLERCNLA